LPSGATAPDAVEGIFKRPVLANQTFCVKGGKTSFPERIPIGGANTWVWFAPSWMWGGPSGEGVSFPLTAGDENTQRRRGTWWYKKIESEGIARTQRFIGII